MQFLERYNRAYYEDILVSWESFDLSELITTDVMYAMPVEFYAKEFAWFKYPKTVEYRVKLANLLINKLNTHADKAKLAVALEALLKSIKKEKRKASSKGETFVVDSRIKGLVQLIKSRAI